jgi:hypothetical protein
MAGGDLAVKQHAINPAARAENSSAEGGLGVTSEAVKVLEPNVESAIQQEVAVEDGLPPPTGPATADEEAGPSRMEEGDSDEEGGGEGSEGGGTDDEMTDSFGQQKTERICASYAKEEYKGEESFARPTSSCDRNGYCITQPN